MLKKICFFTLLFTSAGSLLYGYNHTYKNDTNESIAITAIYKNDLGHVTTGGDWACSRDSFNLEPGKKSNNIDVGACLIDEVFVTNEPDRFVVKKLPLPKYARTEGINNTLDETIQHAIRNRKKWGRWRANKNLGQNRAANKTFKITKDANGNFDLKQ
jgi:hypothetical protein